MIGVLWPGNVDFADYPLPDDVKIVQNIRVDEVSFYAKRLIYEGADILLGTPSMISELSSHSSVPFALGYADYIDILETLKVAEQTFYPKEEHAALIFHETNPIQLERISIFTKFKMSYFRYGDDLYLNEIMDQICNKGYSLVIGGPTACQIAKAKGLKSFQLRYRSYSLITSIQKARDYLTFIQVERNQADFLQTALDTIKDGVLITDDAGYISMCNTQMAAYVGMLKEELTGQQVVDVFGDKEWSSVYKNGISHNQYLTKYRQNTFFLTRRPVLHDSTPIGAIGILQEASNTSAQKPKLYSAHTKGLLAKHSFSDIIAENTNMKHIIQNAKHCSKFDTTILIEGETGSGKEIFAQSIHNESDRKNGPFVAINCAAISSTLLESELMGYDEGAFTGAKRGGKIGLFELAQNGTIFLDEINQLPLDLQPKLLRIIQEKTLIKVGGSESIPIDVRIVAASNTSLISLVQSGQFRSDLYYRLNVLSFTIPPLRDRQDDILPLISHFIKMYENHPNSICLSPDEVAYASQGYSWPGNVRELQNYVERCTILGIENGKAILYPTQCQENTTIQNISAKDNTYIPIKLSSLSQMEHQLVQAVVERCNGNKSRAALILGVNRNTVNSKLNLNYSRST